MARVKRGTTVRAKHKKLLKKAKEAIADAKARSFPAPQGR